MTQPVRTVFRHSWPETRHRVFCLRVVDPYEVHDEGHEGSQPDFETSRSSEWRSPMAPKASLREAQIIEEALTFDFMSSIVEPQ